MGLLKVIDDAPGYAKVTMQGPQGSGKSRTAVEIAIRLVELFGSKKPIAFFDTEGGSDYLVDLIKERTGLEPLRIKTRAFNDLLEVVKECEAGASDVLVTDSITHVWREIQDAYMAAINRNLKWPKTRMALDDIMAVKKIWEPWPNTFLNSRLHIIVCGREGNEWGHEENEDTGKSDLVTVGKKMKVEGEFGYEASLQISMAAVQQAEAIIRKKATAKGQPAQRERRPRTIINTATVLKDRFDVLNGEVFEYPKGSDFDPFLTRLRPAAHGDVNTSTSSDKTIDVDSSGFMREKRAAIRWSEEVQGLLVKHFPGQRAEDKHAKAELLFAAFESRSWSHIEGLDSKRLKDGFEFLKRKLEGPPQQQPATEQSEPAA